MNKIIIIGGGVTSYYLIKNLRDYGSTLPITVVTRELIVPYNRVLLPRVLKEEIEVGKVFFDNFQWYIDNNVKIVGGVDVTVDNSVFSASIGNEKKTYETIVENEFLIPNPDNLSLQDLNNELNSNDTIKIIATGGEAFLPEEYMNKTRVLTWRTLEDTLKIKQALQESKHIGIVGGSFIALELAMASRYYGVDFDWIIMTKGLMRDGLDEKMYSKLMSIWNKNKRKTVTENVYFESKLDNITENPTSISAIIHNSKQSIISSFDKLVIGTGIKKSINLEKQYIKVGSNYYAGDMAVVPFYDRIIPCGSFNQALKIAKYIARDIHGDVDLTNNKVEIGNDIALTPYQIRFEGVPIRMAGIVGGENTHTIIEIQGEKITQSWLDINGNKVGYCSV